MGENEKTVRMRRPNAQLGQSMADQGEDWTG